MPNIGLPELLVIALLLVLLFGARKIPELMKGLGSGIKEFKKAASGDEDTPTPPPSTPSTPSTPMPPSTPTSTTP